MQHPNPARFALTVPCGLNRAFEQVRMHLTHQLWVPVRPSGHRLQFAPNVVFRILLEYTVLDFAICSDLSPPLLGFFNKINCLATLIIPGQRGFYGFFSDKPNNINVLTFMDGN
jgi:hypothetical protein